MLDTKTKSGVFETTEEMMRHRPRIPNVNNTN